jgi:hypothetical protein
MAGGYIAAGLGVESTSKAGPEAALPIARCASAGRFSKGSDEMKKRGPPGGCECLRAPELLRGEQLERISSLQSLPVCEGVQL